MAYLRPGVYVEETLNPIPQVPANESDSVAAFIGATDKGPITPTLVTSWSQYTSLYGTWGSTGNVMATALHLFFANGGSQAYITRVTGSGAATASTTFQDTNTTPANTVTFTAKNAGAWGNSVSIGIESAVDSAYKNVVVYYGGTTADKVVERFTDVTMLTTDPRYLVSVVNATSNYVVAVDESPSDAHTSADNPANTTTPVELAGGANGTAPTSGNIAGASSALDVVRNPLVLNAPGVVAATDVVTLLTYAQGRGDVFVVIDPLSGATVSDQLTRAGLYAANADKAAFGAVYYPELSIPDPVSTAPGATVKAPAGAAVIGRIVATDASRGVFKAPAGLEARLAGVVAVDQLTNAQLDSLNSASAPVNAIRYIPGSGIVIMGARTLKYGYADRYVPVRRSLIYLRKSLSDLTNFAIFEPNDFRLWSRLQSTASNFLTDFWQRGGLRGATPADAFFVKCDSENNTPATIDQGVVNIEIGVALQRPAEFVVIRISQYDSGAVVTIA